MTIRSAAGGPETAIGVIDNILYQRYNLQNPPKNQNAYACSDIRGSQRVNFKADNGQGAFAVRDEQIIFQGSFQDQNGKEFNFSKLVAPDALDTPEEVTQFLNDHHVSPNPEQPSVEIEGKK